MDKVQNARDFTTVKDIKDNFLYTTDGYLIGYLRIYPYNLDLLSIEDKNIKTQTLSTAFNDKKDFCYCTFPREVDLDNYKNFLKSCYQQELQDIGKRRILAIMIKKAQELSTSGENFEHQHFIKLWCKIGTNINDATHELQQRLEDFKSRYSLVGIETEILKEDEIIKLCNLFGNSQQVSYETVDSNTLYTFIPQIK